MLARFYTSAGDAQATTRCVVPARVLPGQVLAVDQHRTMKGMPSVWQNPARHQLASIKQDAELGNRIVIDVDDPYHSPSERYSQAEADAHIEALAYADVLTVTNEALAESYEGLHADIRVIPSCVDAKDFELGRQMQHLDGKLRVGYAAGWSHKGDEKIVAHALKRLKQRVPETIIEFVGAFEPAWDFEYVRYPALPYPAYKALIQTWAIGLAPLVDNEINRCRSDLKALDYAISGAIVVASPIGPYAHLVEQGVIASGEDDEDWFQTLLKLVNDDDLRMRLGLYAHTYCRVERHPANQRTAYVDALGLRRSFAHA